MPKKGKVAFDDEEADDAVNFDEYKDPADKWEGFHFTRLTCVSILTLLIMIAALVLDNLSIWGKRRTCSFAECNISGDQGCSPNCGDSSDGSYEYYPTCEANGQCGWRTGKTSWIQPSPSAPDCPSCSDDTFCVSEETSTPSPTSDSYIDSTTNWDSEYNFKTLCIDYDDDEACMAMNGGNVYMAFTLFAIVFNVLTICLIGPLYCRDRSICSDICKCSVCDEKTHVFLGILYGLTLLCNFIPVAVWMAAADGGMCDNADPNHDDAFPEDTTNYPGYSLGGLMICVVANIIGCGCVCCAWGDNRKYGDERDQAKIDRQKQKEKYREQEMAEQPNDTAEINAGQNNQNVTYSQY